MMVECVYVTLWIFLPPIDVDHPTGGHWRERREACKYSVKEDKEKNVSHTCVVRLVTHPLGILTSVTWYVLQAGQPTAQCEGG